MVHGPIVATATEMRTALAYDGEVWHGDAMLPGSAWLCDKHMAIRKVALREPHSFPQMRHTSPYFHSTITGRRLTNRFLERRIRSWCRPRGLRLRLQTIQDDDGIYDGFLVYGKRQMVRVNPYLLRFISEHVEWDAIRYGGGKHQPVSLWRGKTAVAVLMGKQWDEEA